MSTNQDKFKKIVSHAKEYGFIFQSSEIYDGLSAVYDYAQNGVELKNNIKNYWWSSMVQMNDNIVGLDSSILMHPTTWKASGHVDAFNDPLIDNKDSKKRYRADNLIEDLSNYKIKNISEKINVPSVYIEYEVILKKLMLIISEPKEMVINLISVNVHRNLDKIEKILTLDFFNKDKKYLNEIIRKVSSADFSFLNSVPKDKIDKEKINYLKNILQER